MYDLSQVLALVKQRLDRLPGDTRLDGYLSSRIRGAAEELEKAGIRLDGGLADTMLLTDYTVWQYQNRDNPNAQPLWLRDAIRKRWVQQRGGGAK